jgi:hypothetical protein
MSLNQQRSLLGGIEPLYTVRRLKTFAEGLKTARDR